MKVHFCKVAVSTLFLTSPPGTVRLVFKATSEGYVQARELDDRYRQAKRGRADWATARRRQEADARANQVLEADNSPRLFCHLATVSDMEQIERRVYEVSRARAVTFLEGQNLVQTAQTQEENASTIRSSAMKLSTA
jgi:hypothetical protein